jgi:hypothetical protein
MLTPNPFFNRLGDRHCENILLDIVTGDLIHVDFNCLFEKVLGTNLLSLFFLIHVLRAKPSIHPNESLSDSRRTLLTVLG